MTLAPWDCPHSPTCHHLTPSSGGCDVELLTINRYTRKLHIRLVAAGGYRCPRCSCSRSLRITGHLRAKLHDAPHAWFADNLTDAEVARLRRQANRLGINMLTVRRYGMGTIAVTQEPIPGRGGPLVHPTPTVVVVARLSRVLRRASRPWETITVRWRKRDRQVGVGQVERVDWSMGWRPPSPPPHESTEMKVGVAKPGRTRRIVEDNTEYSVDQPIDEKANLEDAALELRDALAGITYAGWASNNPNKKTKKKTGEKTSGNNPARKPLPKPTWNTYT